MRKLTSIVTLAISTLLLAGCFSESGSSGSTSSVRVGAICEDGWRSSATGRGACSHHGGVARWLYRETSPQQTQTQPTEAEVDREIANRVSLAQRDGSAEKLLESVYAVEQEFFYGEETAEIGLTALYGERSVLEQAVVYCLTLDEGTKGSDVNEFLFQQAKQGGFSAEDADFYVEMHAPMQVAAVKHLCPENEAAFLK